MPAAGSILLVMADQLSATWVEHGRSGAVPLPNISRLQSLGTTFTRAFTNNPVCCPARATIATGLTAHGHGVLECGYRLDPSIPTFMNALRRDGWMTSAVGKVHLLPQLEGVRPDYRPYGFDVLDVSEDPRAGAWLDWVKERHPEHYSAALSTVWMTMVPELRKYGPHDSDLVSEIAAARDVTRFWSPEMPDADERAYVLPFPAEVSQTEWITTRASAVLKSAPRTKRLFLQVGYVQPHDPFSPPSEYVSRVTGVPQPITAEWIDDAEAPAAFRSDPNTVTAASASRVRHLRRMYFADLAHLDAQLGCLLAELEAVGRLEDTYIIFTSDHGELLGDHGFLGKWGRHYDACIRIPLVISGPGFARGLVRDELVDLTDIAPTIYAMARLDPPSLPVLARGPNGGEEMPALPGRSLLSLASDHVDGWRDAVYVESDNPYWSTSIRGWARTIRTATHRYTRFGDGGEQLFDLTSDPDELNNIAPLPAAAASRDALVTRLVGLLMAQDYPPTPRSLYKVLGW